MNINNKEQLMEVVPESLVNDIMNNKELVEANMKFIKKIGISNYDEVFKYYYPMFLMDSSNFQSIFTKYDQSDLLEKINKNITIIEHL